MGSAIFLAAAHGPRALAGVIRRDLICIHYGMHRKRCGMCVVHCSPHNSLVMSHIWECVIVISFVHTQTDFFLDFTPYPSRGFPPLISQAFAAARPERRAWVSESSADCATRGGAGPHDWLGQTWRGGVGKCHLEV